MPLRVNPMMLVGLIVTFVLMAAAFAAAMGGSSGDALAIATAQVGKPYAFATDGPDTFSCAGLMRYALRNAGIDDNAPWGHEEYLSVYPNDPVPQPGDVVVYSNGVAMYVGDGTVVMANAADGAVGYYPMDSIGAPLGFANPYGGVAAPATTGDPATGAATADPAVTGDPAVATDPLTTGAGDPTMLDPTAIDPTEAIDPTIAADPTTAIDPTITADPAIAVDPATSGAIDPLGTGATDPLATEIVDPLVQF